MMRPVAILSLLVITAACAPRPSTAPSPVSIRQPTATARPGGDDTTYDIVIRNGRVLDGEGNPWIAADVGIPAGRFARSGKIPQRARTEIDATGKYVSPGWIDMMDQSGGVLPRNGL